MKIFFRESIISFILSIVLIFILSLIISKTTIAESVIIPGIILISSISIMFGGIRVSRLKKQKGMLNGALLGFIYMFSMYLISSIILKDFSLNLKSMIMFFSGIIAGILGGIIGVNL